MKIGCIGWGSLIWDSKELPLNSAWYEDGPSLPVEFSRESSHGRITLVLIDSENTVNSFWALLSVNDIDEAKNILAKRENISEGNIKYSIGFWCNVSNESHGRCSSEIEEWAKSKNLDGVVWTNLKYGFKSSRDIMPKYSEVLNHFQSLSKDQCDVAEEYVRKTPSQVMTEYREKLEKDLGWAAINESA